MKLRAFTYLLWFGLLLTACSGRFEGMKLELQVDNAEGQTLLVEDVATPEKVIIDSGVVRDGKIVFSLYVNEGIYRIRDAGSNAMIFLYVAPGKTQYVQWDLKQAQEYQVKGNADSELLRQIIAYARKTNLEYRLLDSVSGSSAMDAELTIRAMEMNRERLQKMVEQVLDTVKNADVAAFALNYADLRTENIPFLLRATQTLHERNPRARYAKVWYDTFDSYRKSALSDISNGLAIGQSAPDFSLPDIYGGTLNLSTFKGQYVLIDFWASWCQPCRKENPNIVEAYKKFRKRNFIVISISLDSKHEQWEKGVKADGLVWRHHASDLQKWRSPVVQAYDIKGIPANFLIDTNGVIIARDLKGVALLAFLDQLLPLPMEQQMLQDSLARAAQADTLKPVAPAIPAPTTAQPAVRPATSVQQPPSASPVPPQPKPETKPAPKPASKPIETEQKQQEDAPVQTISPF